jgi:hypothetical protein
VADRLAEQRAKELLPRVLSPGEWASYRRWKRLRITGSAGGRYEIKMNHYVGNVVNLQEVHIGGTVSRRRRAPAGSGLCAHPNLVQSVKINGRWEYVELPQTDAFITQILQIKADEPGFLRIANKYY